MIIKYLNKDNTIFKISILLHLIPNAIQQRILPSERVVVFRNHILLFLCCSWHFGPAVISIRLLWSPNHQLNVSFCH